MPGVKDIVRLALCAAGVVATGCGPKTAAIDRDLAKLIPPGTVAVLDVKAEALRKTPLYAKYVAGRLPASLKVTDDVVEALAVSTGKDAFVFTKGAGGLARYDRAGNKTVPQSSGGGLPPALRELLKSVPPENQIFGAGTGAALPGLEALPQQGNLANLGAMMKSLQGWTVAADLRYDLRMRASASYPTDADARRIHDALKGILGIARLSTPRDAPELLRLYDGIVVTLDRATVRVAADLTPASLEAVSTRLRSLQKR